MRPDSFTEVAAVTNADSIAALSCADVLRQRKNQVVLFTAAPLFTHGGFDRDPVVEFDARFPATSKELRPFCVDLRENRRFFEGLGVVPAPGTTRPVNWDQRLYAIDETRAEECFSFLNGISYSDPKRELFGSAIMHTIDIADPTSLKNDRLLVTVFSAVTNKFVAYLKPRPTACPVLRVRAQRPGLLTTLFTGQTPISGFDGNDGLLMRDE